MGCRNSIRTARLQLDPVSWTDLDDVVRLKASTGVTGRLAGGVCNRTLSEQDMMTDLMTWGREGVGMFAIRQQGHFIGLVACSLLPPWIAMKCSLLSCNRPTIRPCRVRRQAWRSLSRMQRGWRALLPMPRRVISWPGKSLVVRACMFVQPSRWRDPISCFTKVPGRAGRITVYIKGLL